MDALTILKREHTRISQLFRELDALPERACLGRRALMREIDDLVRRHMRMESAFNATAFASSGATAWALLDELAAMDCRDGSYAARIGMLRELLLEHMGAVA